MVSKTNEQALEACIEKRLTGSSKEEREENALREPGSDFKGSHHAYEPGESSDFDREFAIDSEKFWRFLETTQTDELDKIKDRPNWQRLVLERLDRKIKKDGVLSVLKKGLSIDDAHLTLLYRLPYNDLNPKVIKDFDSNIFSVTRQVHYSNDDPALSIDMVIFLNGLPLATLELKNPWTGQNVYHAKKQYMNDRDPKEPLLNFGRCLVHFAVDPDEIYMTTKLDGKSTFFLPFNKGNNFGKGNPPNPLGHKTDYLWKQIFAKRSLTNIIEHFAKFTVEKENTSGRRGVRTKKTLFFPRYHQLDVVRSILRDAKEKGPGQRYLIQHSAGSGKSHSITWTAYQLIELYNKKGTENIFDSVIVVTDRRVLDKQLKNNIKLFSEVKNIVAHAESSADLKSHLENGKKLIITTIQKFPFIVDGIQDLSDRKFAVIVDEAHSSQSGASADKLNISLGADEDLDEEELDLQDKILAAMDARKMSNNASYLAFTATPKNTTLEKFGIQDEDGKFNPFHLYSMKQAIEEGFIMDVLANYTTYKSYYEIHKSIIDNPLFETAKAQKKLRAYVEGHKETIEVKAKIMVDHFIGKVVQSRKLKGQAKGMVVTRNIASAIRYFFAIRKALEEANAPFKAIVAFSGKKSVDGTEHTEESINGFPSKNIEENFDSDEYKLLVVANKFLTGFDQPKLHSMYVDKRLQGVLAVQALSRLNRCNDKLNKKDTFVLDFYNSSSDIKTAFDPFYTATSLSQPTDVNVLHDVKEYLDNAGIYEWSEIEDFNNKFFSGVDAEELHPIIDIVVERFNNDLEEDDKIDFKIKAKQFVKIYAQVACLIPYNNVKWEMLHWFLKFLVKDLIIDDPGRDELDKILESVDLSSYGLERVMLNQMIGLESDETEVEPQNPNPRGIRGEGEQKDPLTQIIETFNEKYFAGWGATPEEQKVKFLNIARNVMNNPNYQAQVLNNQDSQNRRLAMEKLIKSAVSQERKKELDLYRHYAGDEDFKRAFDASIMRLLTQSQTNNTLQAQLGSQ